MIGPLMRRTSWWTPTSLCPRMTTVLQTVLERIQKDEPVYLHNASAKITNTIFTDAAESGWGAVHHAGQLQNVPAVTKPLKEAVAAAKTTAGLGDVDFETGSSSHDDAGDAGSGKRPPRVRQQGARRGPRYAPYGQRRRTGRRGEGEREVPGELGHRPSAEGDEQAANTRDRELGTHEGERGGQAIEEEARESGLQAAPGNLQGSLFASPNNASTKQFVSKTAQPGAAAVNALGLAWNKVTSPYANPPWPLLYRVLEKADRDLAANQRMMLVAPVWKAAPWWPKLEAMTKAKYDVPVDQPVYLQKGDRLMEPPRWRTTIRIVGSNTCTTSKSTTSTGSGEADSESSTGSEGGVDELEPWNIDELPALLDIPYAKRRRIVEAGGYEPQGRSTTPSTTSPRCTITRGAWSVQRRLKK
eukprot:TRINITY_DN2635_c0_g1_i1.p1 TRINITY_DN2635_c0_g1~~TRINITY_DN2635_c0_g1_i1.p1  ORF type:complete len:415 (-),score=28.93 TRINITY_DN2635_c0_g1_i1:1081-2325(-)